jgi:hypothetical protein
MEAISDIVSIYGAIGLLIWLAAAIRAYDQLDVAGLLLGLILCVFFWPILIASALIRLIMDR